MTLADLKKYITDKIIPTEFMIFVNKDNPFLTSQYIKALENLSVGPVHKITSIYEPQQSSFLLLTNADEALNILYTDTFDERAENYNQFENIIVVCEQISKDIAKIAEPYVIKFPKLAEWQIHDYAKTLCPNIEESDLLWLVQASENNLERVINELDKVLLFDKQAQKEIFSAIRFDPQSDLYKVDLFSIVNALVEGDLFTLFTFIAHNGHELCEPVVLVNRALTSLKNIILVSQNPGLSAAQCGISVNQFNFIKYKYKNLNTYAVRQKIKFLANFDLLLKTSKLELNKRDMLSYVISHMAYKITN